jgi:hypothetical protein
MWPGLGAVGVIFAALLALTGVASGVDRPGLHGDTATTVHLYAPFNGGGIASGVQVARSASGYCWTSSGADARDDAFRCFVGSFIHDPCFANQTSPAKYVLCPLYLPVSKVLRLNLTKKLPPNPATGDPTRHAPWAVRTASGKWCTSFTGATGQIAGMSIHYGCVGGGVLLGDPHRSASAPWTIFYASSFKANQYRPVRLASVWW